MSIDLSGSGLIICNECNGCGIIKAPKYDICTGCGETGTAINYCEYICNECDGKGFIDINDGGSDYCDDDVRIFINGILSRKVRMPEKEVEILDGQRLHEI